MSSTAFPPVIAIYGPTGVGKTACAVHLGQRFEGEVVNADSRYLYRRLNIGVAKPTVAERGGVRHHLIDVFDPDEHITLATVQAMAYDAIRLIQQHANVPIVVGGTPLYMNAILEGWRMPEVAPDWTFRAELEDRLKRNGLPAVVAELAAVDPIAAERSAQNPRRLIRALEIHRATGRPMSELEHKEPPPYRALKLALNRDRTKLYRILDDRVDEQIRTGLVEEVAALLESGLTGTEPAFSAIGYRQLVPVIQGTMPLADAVARIKVDTHRYVRHQMTWLRRNPDLVWIDTGEPGWLDQVEIRVRAFLADDSPVES
jgi:tRNA dimethylallyltransferase